MSRKFAISCCSPHNHFRRLTGHTKRNRFVVITPKTSVKTEWGEFDVTTKCAKFLTKHIRCAHNMKQKSTIVLVNERIHGRAPAICPYSIRIFQVYITVEHAMNTLEFYRFGVKITYSTIKVYTRRSHILWIHSLNFASRRMLCTRTVTFFHKILFVKGSPSYFRSTTDVWYTLTKIHERLRREHISLYSIRIFQVYVTYCVRLKYSRILLRHNHKFESRILWNTLVFTQWLEGIGLFLSYCGGR